MKAYQPKPIDTAKVDLGPDLMGLAEKLAENAHENWAKQRMSDGWTFGEKRDDDERRHPSLIPYSELSESEKEYDRITAMETLKAVVSLGYVVSKQNS